MDNATAATPSPTTPGAPPPVDLTDRTLGEFHILRKLGQGGMGQVYLAEQLSLKRKVALKILRADVAANPSALQRFKVEAEAVAKATHANIVQVYLINEADGFHYMALEYVEGRNLREYITKKGPPDLLLALSIMRQVAAALQRAGELGIIHRDIKPENILLTRKGEAKVADFGLSRSLTGDQMPLNITQSGVVMGTPLYMSPEQVEGKGVDARTDIYSFGVTAYHMMAGHPPFEGKGAFEVALKHVREEPPTLHGIRPDLPEAFCAVIHKMMAKRPDDRYQSCRELLRDLAAVREAVGGTSGTHPRLDISVELVEMDAGQPSAGARLVPTLSGSGVNTAPATAAKTQSIPAHRSPWLWVAGTLAVVAALASGVALAGLQHLSASSLTGVNGTGKPHGTAPLPPEAQELDAILNVQSPVKREKVLHDAVEEYLSPANLAKTPQVGVGLCLDLAVFYFEQDKLDEAEKLFARLEAIQVRPYPTLGKFGRGIVLALRSQAVESNKVFLDVFANSPLKDLPGGVQPGTPRPTQQPEFAIWNNAPFRFWVAQALHFNEKNEVPKSKWPDRLQKFKTGMDKP